MKKVKFSNTDWRITTGKFAQKVTENQLSQRRGNALNVTSINNTGSTILSLACLSLIVCSGAPQCVNAVSKVNHTQSNATGIKPVPTLSPWFANRAPSSQEVFPLPVGMQNGLSTLKLEKFDKIVIGERANLNSFHESKKRIERSSNNFWENLMPDNPLSKLISNPSSRFTMFNNLDEKIFSILNNMKDVPEETKKIIIFQYNLAQDSLNNLEIYIENMKKKLSKLKHSLKIKKAGDNRLKMREHYVELRNNYIVYKNEEIICAAKNLVLAHLTILETIKKVNNNESTNALEEVLNQLPEPKQFGPRSLKHKLIEQYRIYCEYLISLNHVDIWDELNIKLGNLRCPYKYTYYNMEPVEDANRKRLSTQDLIRRRDQLT